MKTIKKTVPCLGQVQTLTRTGSHKIVYPVQGREAKNHTLSSGTSPYRPYKGVPLPPPPESVQSTDFVWPLVWVETNNFALQPQRYKLTLLLKK